MGTFDWLVSIYKSHPAYTERPPKTKKSFDAALALVSKHKLKDGRLFGSLPLGSITPGAADRLFAKLKQKPGGGERLRTALSSICPATSPKRADLRTYSGHTLQWPFASRVTSNKLLKRR